jgi:general secretion pathway protein L
MASRFFMLAGEQQCWQLDSPEGSLIGPLPPVRAQAEKAERVLLLAAEECLIRPVQAPPRGRAEWLKGLPYHFEELCAGDVERMHFAFAGDSNGRGHVLAVEQTILQAALEQAQAVGFDPDWIVADALLMDPGVAGRVLVLARRVLFHFAGGLAGACERPLFPAVLAAAGGAPGAAVHQLGATNVPGLGGKPLDSEAALLLPGFKPQLPNLRSGSFARRVRGVARRPQLRLAAGLAATALLVHLATLGAAIRADSQRLASIDAEIARLFHATLGEDARLVDALAQLESTARSRGGASSTDFIGLLRAAAPVLATETRLRLTGLEYRDGSLELALAAPDVGTLDSLRERLNSVANLSAELGGTQFGEGEFIGRLRLKGRGA